MATIAGLFRLGRDAELRKVEDGTSVLNLALAYNHGQKGQDGKRPSQWVDAAMFGKRAEAIAQYLTKGVSVFATLDDPYVHTYTKKDGGTGSTLRAKVSQIEFAGGSGQQATKPAPKPAPAAAGDFSDDCPF